MKSKLITAIFCTAMLNIAAAKGSSYPKSDVSLPVSQPCMVEVSTVKTVRYMNANTIRYVEVNTEKPKQVLISFLGNHQQTTVMAIDYQSHEHALSAMKALIKSMSQCSF